jgi:hypothetical protein
MAALCARRAARMEVREQRQEIDAMGASGNGGNGNGDAEGGPARITIEDALAAFGVPRDPEGPVLAGPPPLRRRNA